MKINKEIDFTLTVEISQLSQPDQPCPPAILSSTPELGWTPLSCSMGGCWQITSILANIGLKNFKIALISYNLSKAASKAAENNGLII